jgi:hypothetical protein
MIYMTHEIAGAGVFQEGVVVEAGRIVEDGSRFA